MDVAVQIVNAYLQLNGYFTIGEFPIVEARRQGGFATATDIDILALRFPHTEHNIPVRSDDEDVSSHASILLQVDSELDLPTDCMDMIIGEVKQSTAEVNPRLLDPIVLHTVLGRTGCCPPHHARETIEMLLRSGSTTVEHSGGRKCRIRLMAFGGSTSGGGPIRKMSLQHVVTYILEHLKRYSDPLRPAQFGDPALGLFHLLNKLDCVTVLKRDDGRPG